MLTITQQIKICIRISYIKYACKILCSIITYNSQVLKTPCFYDFLKRVYRISGGRFVNFLNLQQIIFSETYTQYLQFHKLNKLIYYSKYSSLVNDLVFFLSRSITRYSSWVAHQFSILLESLINSAFFVSRS